MMKTQKSGYGIPSAIPTTLQIVAVFALGDASENKFHPVAVLPFMAFHGNTSGQVNACAAVHKTATIATSGLLLLKPLARLFVVAKSPNRGNFFSSHKDSHNHCFVSPCLRQFQKTLLWLAGKQLHLSSTHILYTTFSELQARQDDFFEIFWQMEASPM